VYLSVGGARNIYLIERMDRWYR